MMHLVEGVSLPTVVHYVCQCMCVLGYLLYIQLKYPQTLSALHIIICVQSLIMEGEGAWLPLVLLGVGGGVRGGLGDSPLAPPVPTPLRCYTNRHQNGLILFLLTVISSKFAVLSTST